MLIRGAPGLLGVGLPEYPCPALSLAGSSLCKGWAWCRRGEGFLSAAFGSAQSVCFSVDRSPLGAFSWPPHCTKRLFQMPNYYRLCYEMPSLTSSAGYHLGQTGNPDSSPHATLSPSGKSRQMGLKVALVEVVSPDSLAS